MSVFNCPLVFTVPFSRLRFTEFTLPLTQPFLASLSLSFLSPLSLSSIALSPPLMYNGFSISVLPTPVTGPTRPRAGELQALAHDASHQPVDHLQAAHSGQDHGLRVLSWRYVHARLLPTQTRNVSCSAGPAVVVLFSLHDPTFLRNLPHVTLPLFSDNLCRTAFRMFILR